MQSDPLLPGTSNHQPLRTPFYLAQGRLRFTKEIRSGLEFGGFGEAELAFSQGIRKDFFHFRLFAIARHGEFADDEVAGTFQHLLFSKRKRFGLMQSDEALEDASDLDQ